MLPQNLKMYNFRLALVIVFSSVLRFWHLGLIPPIQAQTYFNFRFVSSIHNIGCAILLYYICKKIFKVEKIALLSSFIFAVLPWTLEQGRIYSQPQNVLFWLLLIFFLNIIWKNIIIHVVSIFIIPFLFYLLYPQFWILKSGLPIIPINSLINNIFALFSPDFWFFKNNTFWWGGIRDSGIINLAFLPFLIIGLFQTKIPVKARIFTILLLITLVSAASPFYPESREFFLVTPVAAVLISFGIYFSFNFLTKNIYKLVIFVFLLLFIYDFSCLLHLYSVHYQQQVAGNLSQIHEPF